MMEEMYEQILVANNNAINGTRKTQQLFRNEVT